MVAEIFDSHADLYEALVDWPKRLANEAPFYRALFERHAVRSVLDVACGTGRHAALFHSWGLRVEGADISSAMISQCRAHAPESDTLRWVVRSFDQPPSPPGTFDAAISVGNSLALAPTDSAVEQAIAAMLAALRPGGVAIVQVLNLWALPEGPCVWHKCVRATLQGVEHVLLRGVHRLDRRAIVEFVDLNLAAAQLSPRFESAALLAIDRESLTGAFARAGARRSECFGDMQRSAYDPERSVDLIVVAEK